MDHEDRTPRGEARGDDADGARDLPASSRGSAHVGSGILLSRLTGLARERALGHYFGTSGVADAFTAAFRIPNLLQHLLGEGVLSASFIPVYSRLLADGREEEAGRVAGAVAGLLAVATGLLVLVGMLLAEPLTVLIAGGLRARPETFELTVRLVRILFPAVGVLVLSAWCLGVLNSHRRFFLSYVAPVLLNVAQIAVLVGAGSVVLADELATPATALSAQATLVTWLAVGTIVGALLQLAVQLPGVLRVARGLRPSLRTDLPGVRATVKAFGPVVLGRGVVQLSAYVQVLLASFLAAGALASLRYAQILYTLPVALFGMSVAAAELPELSRAAPDQRRVGRGRLDAGLARIAVLVVPTVLGYLVVGDLVVGALYGTGAFGRLQSVTVWLVLCGYAVGLLATTSSRRLESALYSAGNTRTPARVASLRVLMSVALGAVLMLQLDRVAVTEAGLRLVGDLPAFAPLPAAERAGDGSSLRLGAAGLSVAGGLAAWAEYVLLRRRVARDVAPTALGGGRLSRLLLAAVPAAVVAAAARPLLLPLPPLLGGLGAVAIVAVVHLGAATALGVPEVREVLRALRRRLPGG